MPNKAVTNLEASSSTGFYKRLHAGALKFFKSLSIKRLRSRISKFVALSIRLPRAYRKNSRRPIDADKVLFIEPSGDSLSNNYQCIYDELIQNYTYEIHIHLLHNWTVSKKDYYKNCQVMLSDLATAKYVFIDEACDAFSKIKLRSETTIAQTWHGCGAFKKFGFSTADLLFGATRKDMEKYPFYQHCSFVTVSSPEVIWAYSEAMGLPEGKILPIGVSRTDTFFNKSFLSNAKKKFELYMPSSKGKKVILFAPTFRGRIAKARTATDFSIARFYQELSDDYVLVLKHHPHVKKPPRIPKQYREFAVDFSNVMSIEELLCVADICISDYSSLVFEYALFERPMIFYDYDIDEYFDWRGFYYDYNELTPGPAFQTNREMIDYIKHIDQRFDKQQVVDFKNKFMSACDGHSTQRLMDKVFGEDLKRHRLETESTRSASVIVEGNLEDPVSKLPESEKLGLSQKTKEQLFNTMPQLIGKTIIGYFPTLRGEKGYPVVNPYINWRASWEDLPDRYVVLYIGDLPDGRRPAKFRQKRFINCTELLSRDDLVAISDIIVTDFDFNIGAYCLPRKRTVFYIPDYRWYCSSVNEYEDSTASLRINNLLCESTEEFIEALGNDWLKVTDTDALVDAYRLICQHIR